MKKLLYLLCLTPMVALAWSPPDYEVNFSTQTRSVALSSNPATPTLLFTREPGVQRTWIVNPSSYTIFVATSNVAFSTTTFFGIPGVTPGAGAADVIFSPDGVNAPFAGPLYGVSGNQATPPTIRIFRAK